MQLIFNASSYQVSIQLNYLNKANNTLFTVCFLYISSSTIPFLPFSANNNQPIVKSLAWYSIIYCGIPSTKYELNDTGNAHRFIDKFGPDLHYNVDNKMWMVWNGSNWQFDVFNNVKNLAEILIEEMKIEAMNLTDADKQKELLKNVNKLKLSVIYIIGGEFYFEK